MLLNRILHPFFVEPAVQFLISVRFLSRLIQTKHTWKIREVVLFSPFIWKRFILKWSYASKGDIPKSERSLSWAKNSENSCWELQYSALIDDPFPSLLLFHKLYEYRTPEEIPKTRMLHRKMVRWSRIFETKKDFAKRANIVRSSMFEEVYLK